MNPAVTIAQRAARKAGMLIMRHLDRVDSLKVTAKQRNDFVSEVDQLAEMEIVHSIRKAYPDHAFLGEEGGVQGDSDHLWVIDPLDGTTNFLHGFPHFAVSIALKVRGRLEAAVVYDPFKQETFSAARGDGAYLNERRIRVSRRTGLEGALIATGFPFRTQGHLPQFLNILREVLSQTAGVRRAGSAALDLAYTAAGRVDGYWEYGLKEWDIAAGALLVKEAGGLVCDFEGAEDYLQSGNIVCGAPKVLKNLLPLVQAGTG
jgi:myo-inositol-1(or 4)-monophosphatase